MKHPSRRAVWSGRTCAAARTRAKVDTRAGSRAGSRVGNLAGTQAGAQAGLGIIEVLIALVVVSFGVLGMAGLQLTGMKHSSSGFNRSKALMHAENMATRLRINPPAVANGLYANVDSDTQAAGFCDARPTPYCQATDGGAAASCSAAELATFDIWSVSCGEWAGSAAAGGVLDSLPSGRLQVQCGGSTCAVDAAYTITVEWNEGSVTSDDPDVIDTRRVQMRLRP